MTAISAPTTYAPDRQIRYPLPDITTLIQRKINAIKPAKKQTDAHAVTYVVTAYTVGDDYTPSHGITASGERVKAGYTAACPPELPFGTELRIEGVGRRTCTDRGGRIRGRHIDLYMTTKKAALQFGRQRLKVEIIRKGDD